MKIHLIAAVANNQVIGGDNRLLWHLPADLKHFKDLTMGHTLIMGRKTFESIGKPLKGRRTIVITSQTEYNAQGCLLARSLREALTLAGEEKEVFIAGGGQVYDQAIRLPQASRIHLTRIFASFTGDTFFPEIDPAQWELSERSDREADEKNPYPYSFQVYKRKRRNPARE
jgi:dihydrofolate reductase